MLISRYVEWGKEEFGEEAASISGTLWRSEAWDAKFERESAAAREERTQAR